MAAKTKDETIKSLLEYYDDTDVKKLVNDDDVPFYVVDAEVIDDLVAAFGGKLKDPEDVTHVDDVEEEEEEGE